MLGLDSIIGMKSSPNTEMIGPIGCHVSIQKEISLASPIWHVTKDCIKCHNANILRYIQEHLASTLTC